MPHIRSLHPRFVAGALGVLVATGGIAVGATSGRAQAPGATYVIRPVGRERLAFSDVKPIDIIAMTMLEADDMVVQALRAGARGYLVKGAPQREIVDTIRGVHAGRAVIGSDIARRLAALVGGSAPADPFPDLTDREREVLDLLAAGATTTQIADRFGLSPKTVRNHLSSTFTKIEAVDRTQAVLKARAAGLPRARER